MIRVSVQNLLRTFRSSTVPWLVVAISWGVSQPADAQTEDQARDFRIGDVTENVVSNSDPGQQYAVFLPSNYDPDFKAPVLFLMDPRGRAAIPMALFREAADRYGFVMLSSYNTLSDADSAFAANDKALSAMLVDARTRLSVDAKRFYLVGFSGTAHYSWTIAPNLDGRLAGIMGVGGGLPAYSDPIQKALKMIYPFAFFATAGMADFNFDGVRYLDESLDQTAYAHRLVTHDGDHAWPPKHIADAAVEWFHLQAIRTGLADRDDVILDAIREKYLSEAAALETSGKLVDAYRRYREIVQDFDGLGGVSEAEKRFEALGRNRSVKRGLKRRTDLTRKVIEYKLEVRDFYLDYRTVKKRPSTKSALKRLDVDKLTKKANSDDVEESFAAKRMLATVFVNTGFYEPRDYFRGMDYARAAGMLRIAMAVNPDVPRVCYQLARAAAQLKSLDEAFEALTCGSNASWATKELIEDDELLAPLRADSRYAAFIAN